MCVTISLYSSCYKQLSLVIKFTQSSNSLYTEHDGLWGRSGDTWEVVSYNIITCYQFHPSSYQVVVQCCVSIELSIHTGDNGSNYTMMIIIVMYIIIYCYYHCMLYICVLHIVCVCHWVCVKVSYTHWSDCATLKRHQFKLLSWNVLSY